MAGASSYLAYLGAIKPVTSRPSRDESARAHYAQNYGYVPDIPTSTSQHSPEVEAMREQVQGDLQNIFKVQGGLNEYGLPAFADYVNSAGVSSAISSQFGSGYNALLNSIAHMFDYNNYADLLAGETAYKRNQEMFDKSILAQKELMQIENEYDSQSAKQAMEHEAEQADKLMKWQEHMSNTAYSRAIDDLVEKGVNPILAFNSGAASTPNGAAASGFSAQSGTANVGYTSVSRDQFDSANMMDLITTGINSATSIERGILDVLRSVISVVGYGSSKK